jgi:hypothetical protein
MIIALLAISALSAVSAAAQTAPVSPPPERDRLICRSPERTGTRINGGRLCRTESQWRKDKEDAERVLNGRRDLTDPEPYRPGDMTVRQPK